MPLAALAFLDEARADPSTTGHPTMTTKTPDAAARYRELLAIIVADLDALDGKPLVEQKAVYTALQDAMRDATAVIGARWRNIVTEACQSTSAAQVARELNISAARISVMVNRPPTTERNPQ